ncbi:MAG: glyceraldehyde-3-phosphate:ferredoxin oxidoreductase [Thermoprotei archaeon]|nr:MAG: glyceraldehyde-3-phosphate:ferredoxin oxidoreductase [Thermoprotei archaeon]RLF20323.1 MAG: glyceraldehyde-3-phosphate:ferredoxin oxidoreductase [Thermoprotei archaeon]
MKHKVAFIDVGKRSTKIEEIERDDIIGPVDWGLYCHMELYKSYEYPPYDEHNVFCMGMGKLAGGVLPGTHRLIGVFRSPLWGGIYISTMGGAAYPFRFVGLDFITIEGKSEEPVIVMIKGTKEGIETKFETIPLDELMKIYESYDGEEGVYALSKYLLKKYRDYYRTDSGYMQFRILVVGPAGVNTNMGGIFSYVIRNGEFDVGAEDWMARGGGGSVLFRAHGVVAVIYGGDNDWRKYPGLNLKDTKAVNEIFEKHLGKPMNKAAFDATEKYRYSPSVGTGGTFGVNYATLKDRSLFFNWNNIYLDKERRSELYEKLIKGHYLRQFNEEIIAKKSFKTCGEPCPAVCKKVYEKYKKDYEVYTALGTICGIFDQRAAEKAVHVADAMGFDAIEFGTLCGWILECLHRGLLMPEEVGVDEKPKFDIDSYSIEDSEVNARIVEKLARNIAFARGEIPKILGEGMRIAAKELSEKFKEREEKLGVKFKDIAVYVPLGEKGCIAPCQYWDPAFLVPLPFQGTFFTRYHAPFTEPEEFAQMCMERTLREMMFSENMGLCRFHRGWGEKLANILLNEAYKVSVDLVEHGKKVLSKVIEYDVKAGAKPVFWEGERVVDIFWTFVKEEAKAGNEKAKEWLDKYGEDKHSAAKDYWKRFLESFEKLVGKEWH